MIVLMGILLIATTLYLFWASDVFPEVNEFLDNTTAVEMGRGHAGVARRLGVVPLQRRVGHGELDAHRHRASRARRARPADRGGVGVGRHEDDDADRLLGELIITLIYIIVICISRRKIVICVTVVKEATKAVKAQPLMMVFPLWMMTAQRARRRHAPAASQASPTLQSLPHPLRLHRPGGAPRLRPLHLRIPRQRRAHRRLIHRPLMRPVESSSYEEYMQYYNATAGEGAAYFQSLDATAGQVKAVTVLYFFFGFLWTSQVLLALNGMIIAGAVCSWYWRVSINLPITKAATRTLLSHIGTVCFGHHRPRQVRPVRADGDPDAGGQGEGQEGWDDMKLAFMLRLVLPVRRRSSTSPTSRTSTRRCRARASAARARTSSSCSSATWGRWRSTFRSGCSTRSRAGGSPSSRGGVAYEVLGILGVGTRMYAVALIFLMSVFFSRMFASVFETTIDCIFVRVPRRGRLRRARDGAAPPVGGRRSRRM